MWLRLYTDLLNDPKVQRLAPEHFKGWVNLLCLAKENDGLLPSIEDIAWRLRIEDDKAQELIEALKARGLLDGDGGDLTPHNWATRQYETEATPCPSEKGSVGNHVRWHVGRGILADECIYCRPDIAPTSQGIPPDIPCDSPCESGGYRGDIRGISGGNRAEQSRADSETEAETDSEAAAEQSRGDCLPACLPAAAAADFDDAHISVFAFAEVERFVIATKPHARNPGGLARRLWRSGEEDGAIGLWKEKRAGPQTIWPKWVFEGDVESNKRRHLQMMEHQRWLEAEFKQEAAESAA